MIFLDVVIGVALFLAIDFGFTRSDFAYRTIPDVFRIPDRPLHHALRPNVSAALSQWETAPYPYGTNSLRLRDASARTVAPVTDQRARVLILGDSITKGMGLPWEETFVGLVAHELDDVEVLNGALTAYGPSLISTRSSGCSG